MIVDKISSDLTSASPLGASFREWSTLLQDVPKGFEKFFPDGKKSQKSPSATQKGEVLIMIAFVFVFLKK